MPRSIRTIALDIQRDWGAKVNYAARPYLSAMFSLDNTSEKYGFDDGASIVRYFLANAGTYRGARARSLKEELKALL